LHVLFNCIHYHLLHHFALEGSSTYQSIAFEHHVYHFRFVSIDVALGQHSNQSVIEHLILLTWLEFGVYVSLYYCEVKIYILSWNLFDATIRNFILLVGLILHLFSSINRFTCPISRNSHQISYILKVFYNDIRVYFNVCTKIIYNMYTYVYYSYNELKINI
jgi:hypothetical protein